MENSGFNYRQFIASLSKYVLEGLAVAFAVYLISGQRYGYKETALIGLSAALTFLVLDMVSPVIAGGSRLGTGFGLGANLVGASKVFGSPAVLVEPFHDSVENLNEVPIDMNQVDPSQLGGGSCGTGCSCDTVCTGTCGPTTDCSIKCDIKNSCVGASDISNSNCPYRIIDGYYSKAVVPGYNECVRPYNE